MNHEKINRKPYSDICYDKGKKKKEKALGLSLAEKVFFIVLTISRPGYKGFV